MTRQYVVGRCGCYLFRVKLGVSDVAAALAIGRPLFRKISN